jgi:hypothetical protein
MINAKLVKEMVEKILNIDDVTKGGQQQRLMLGKHYYRYFLWKYVFMQDYEEASEFLNITRSTLHNSLQTLNNIVDTETPESFFRADYYFKNLQDYYEQAV